MMIWGDMLQPLWWYNSPKAEIPKDIVLLDFVWYFRPDEDTEDRLLARGFKVIMGMLYTCFFRICRKKRGCRFISAYIRVWHKRRGRDRSLMEHRGMEPEIWGSGKIEILPPQGLLYSLPGRSFLGRKNPR